MKYEPIFMPDAWVEYQHAFNWYEALSVGLGISFEQKVDECLERLKLNPETSSLINKKYRNALVDIFPYLIIYRVDKKRSTLYIHSIFHTSRKPKKKYRKL